ncbi:SET domain-containing protein, partial [Candidatus Babeliales bacterium]|nr:SET domain-containing protein [Candidatus Babeliales bacterium]
FIGVYAGTLRVTRFDDKSFTEDVDYAWSYIVPTKDDKKMIIDGKYKGNELRFINHDSDPNVQCVTVVVDGVYYLCYVALKNIPAHTQLTVSYGDGYWFSRDVNPSEIISK